jgi:NADH:ubiquinone oxidoreductase subunit 2 (subunit N)
MLSWLFVTIIPMSYSLSYLIIQRYFLVIRIIRLLWIKEMLVACFLLKLGLPPFHMWFIRILRALSNKVFLFASTVHKILPLFFIRKMMNLSTLLLRVSIIILTRVYLLESRSLFPTLVFSSITHTVWIIMRGVIRVGFILIYFIFYSVVLCLLLVNYSSPKLNQTYLTSKLAGNLRWLTISGIPPFVIFWVKVSILFWLLLSFRTLICFIILIASIVALARYFRAMYHTRLIPTFTITLNPLIRVRIVVLYLGVV